jgi:GNAT superfamily N-acetyltransferase
VYDARDQITVDNEPRILRLVYVSVRASQQTGAATFIQCRIEQPGDGMWIASLQVSNRFRRQGLGREMVTASEAMARRIGVSTVKIWPLLPALGFWVSLGYREDPHTSRVLYKEV